jgi:hypothetical protein
MTACLSDRLLWVLSEGDGTAVEREHLAQCRLCADRARQFADDLALIGGVLRAPAPAVAARGARTVRLSWRLAGALVAVFVLALVFSLRPGKRSPGGTDVDGVATLTALSTSLFGEDLESSGSATDLDVVATAFDAAGPCEWQAGGCEYGTE